VEGGTLSPGLYVVATPIGNLQDVTLRALEILRAATVVACEDTRITAKLLSRHDIRVATTPYHEHNAARATPKLLKLLSDGNLVALVSDAGTPLVSDPGYRLVRASLDAGHPVIPVPGPSAPLAAMVASGISTSRFLFAGFLPPRSAARRKALGELRSVPATLVFLESPRRLSGCLADLAMVLGDREAAVARELTKRFEEFHRGRLGTLAAEFARVAVPKGEITVVVGPPAAKTSANGDAIDSMLGGLLLEGVSIRTAVDWVAAATAAPRREVYARANKLKLKVKSK